MDPLRCGFSAAGVEMLCHAFFLRARVGVPRSSWRARRAASCRGERDEANESMLFLGDCLTSVREGFHGAGSSIIFGGRCVASYEASMQYVHEQAMAVRALRVPQCGDWCERRELGPRQWCARAACCPWLTLAVSQVVSIGAYAAAAEEAAGEGKEVEYAEGEVF